MKNTSEQRQKLFRLLGDLPPIDRNVTARKIKEIERDTCIIEILILDLNGFEQVPAYFVKPKNTTGKIPAVVFNHSHGGNYLIGKDELLNGREYLQKPSYAEELVQAGYAVLSIDTWAFGERKGRTESEIFKQMLWSGQVMWGMMVYDSIKAVDYLTSRPDVAANRIGTVGISMGGTMSWWLAALDERVKVCVDMCSLIDFQALIETRGLDRHNLYFYVPSLLKYFTTADILALIAPRPHLSLTGKYDQLTPAVGFDKIDQKLKEVYQQQNNPDGWQLKSSQTGHYETAEMRAEVISFFKNRL